MLFIHRRSFELSSWCWPRDVEEKLNLATKFEEGLLFLSPRRLENLRVLNLHGELVCTGGSSIYFQGWLFSYTLRNRNRHDPIYIYKYTIGFWKQARYLAQTRSLQNSDLVAEDEPIARPLHACQMNLNWWFDQKAPADTLVSWWCILPLSILSKPSSKSAILHFRPRCFLHEHVLQSAVLSRRKSCESWMP